MINTNAQENVRIKYKKYIKSRLTTTRYMGLVMSFVVLALIALQYFQVLTGLWNCVSILYSCGVLFTLFAQYQDLYFRKKLAVTSRVLATILYLLTASLLILIILDRFFVISL